MKISEAVQLERLLRRESKKHKRNAIGPGKRGEIFLNGYHKGASERLDGFADRVQDAIENCRFKRAKYSHLKGIGVLVEEI